MRRREFIAGLGSAAMWPLAARGQQGGPMRRIGVLMGWSESDPAHRASFGAFVEALARLGWTVGGNVRIEQRWTNAEFGRIAPFAKELVALNPDVILSSTTPVTAALHRETNTIPIVFAVVSDPVGAGLVASLSRPGGNITGFINVEETMGGKWLALLKQIAPGIKRAGIMFNPDTAPGGGGYFLGSFEAAARTLAVEPVTLPVRSDAEINTAIVALGRDRAGLVVMTDSFMGVHRGMVILAAVRNNVPAIGEGSPLRQGWRPSLIWTRHYGLTGARGPSCFTVEFAAEDGANAKYFLERALDRASMALKDSIEQGTPGAAAGTGIRPNSTSIIVTSQVE